MTPVVEHPVSRDPGLAERAEAWLADPDRVDGPLRTAATVMLVRDGADGPEVYVQRRVPSMAFAPSTVVFPGGGVDPADHGLDPTTPGLAALAEAMGVTPGAAAPFAAAAVREVEEESGVRLTVADLRGRAHWVTPAFEPRRYDTWILAAAMPAGQEARETSTESDRSGWVRAADLLARHAAGEVRMLPPTVVSLQQLGAFEDAAGFLADRPRIARVLPELVRRDDGTLVLRTALP
ncbi:NUDIX domain-containing protein [Oryzobacter telluris]|uniref:NUDIX hydrolase n=1 Tax=Oryzobacter telluris TaxID=3149179 RepID=UPI00370DB21E